ncbi:hypothetical protein HMPREF9946_04554 [Acetobacteraceae bacterium AT-5844]|nr:hypothetical protein HMPREF9946_04554 [Acetobacteraceae bacterium AT-5844]
MGEKPVKGEKEAGGRRNSPSRPPSSFSSSLGSDFEAERRHQLGEAQLLKGHAC